MARALAVPASAVSLVMAAFIEMPAQGGIGAVRGLGLAAGDDSLDPGDGGLLARRQGGKFLGAIADQLGQVIVQAAVNRMFLHRDEYIEIGRGSLGRMDLGKRKRLMLGIGDIDAGGPIHDQTPLLDPGQEMSLGPSPDNYA